MAKQLTSIRISAEAIALRAELSRQMGISLGAVVEMAIRDLATARGVTVPPTGTKAPARKAQTGEIDALRKAERERERAEVATARKTPAR